MKERPILFSTEMVRAILDGSKTQTRRVIKNPEKYERIHECAFCAKWQPGDILWVRETFTKTDFGEYNYKSDWEKVGIDKKDFGNWKPSIHMPKEAARIFLEVTNIRVDRLQDISTEDAMKEGVALWASSNNGLKYEEIWKDNTDNEPYPVHAFRKLWKSINNDPKKPETHWDANPWVWVIEFKMKEKYNQNVPPPVCEQIVK